MQRNNGLRESTQRRSLAVNKGPLAQSHGYMKGLWMKSPVNPANDAVDVHAGVVLVLFHTSLLIA